MIVDPGLPDHWKMRQLESLSGRPDAIKWLMRLWGNCQIKRTSRFPDNPARIASICGFDGDPKQFIKWLVDLELLERDGTDLIVHQWDEYNHQLVTNWNNGKFGHLGAESGHLGGRPKTPKTPIAPPKGSHRTGDREIDRRIEGEKERGCASSGKPTQPAAAAASSSSDSFPDKEWIDAKKKDPTYAGIDVDRVVGKCRNWCEANKKDFTQSRVIDWLNREHKEPDQPAPSKPVDRLKSQFYQGPKPTPEEEAANKELDEKILKILAQQDEDSKKKHGY